MHHPTFIGNRKQSFSPRSAKRSRNTSKPVWTNAVTSPPLWFHLTEFLETKPRYRSTTKPCRKPRQEIRKVLFRNFKLYKGEDEHCNCKSHTSLHPMITHPHEPSEATSPVVGRCRLSRPLGRLQPKGTSVLCCRIEQKSSVRK